MLILKRFNDKTNLVQLIIGPETDFQLDIAGALFVDIGNVLKGVPDAETRNTMLMITRTHCESWTANNLKERGGSSEEPSCQCGAEDCESNTEEGPKKSREEEPKPVANDPRGIYLETLACSSCSTDGSFVKTGEVPRCAMCIKIDAELERAQSEQSEGKDECM